MTAGAFPQPTTQTRTKGSTPMQTLRDTWLIFRRSVILTLRQPTWLLFGIMYPVLYLVLFGPLLDKAVGAAGGGVSATNWFVPGLLVQVALFGSAFVGFGLIAELRYGVVERMRVLSSSASWAPRAAMTRFIPPTPSPASRAGVGVGTERAAQEGRCAKVSRL